jgi:hypothetical protein
MKAGKSTLLNAIIGQEILPSRVDAMTVIPTEITFDAGDFEPRMKIHSATVKLYKESWIKMNKILQDPKEFTRIEGICKRYDTLKKFPASIRNTKALNISEEIIGLSAIGKLLELLNDLMRLFLLANGEYIDIAIYPRITVPMPNNELLQQVSNSGKLVLIDTPGANEAEIFNYLRVTVDRQIKDSSVLTIVVNIKDCRSEAADSLITKIKDSKKDPYIVVNQIDLIKKPSEIDSAENFCREHFGNKIYKTSASMALLAIKVQELIRKKGGFEVRDVIKTSEGIIIEEYLESRYVEAWRDKSDELNSSDLQKLTEETINKYEFNNFIRTAVQDLMLNAERLCLEVAVKECYQVLEGLEERLANIIIASGKERNVFQSAISDLEIKLTDIEDIKFRLKDKVKEEIKDTQEIILNAITIEFSVAIDKLEELFKEYGVELTPSVERRVSYRKYFQNVSSNDSTDVQSINFTPEGKEVKKEFDTELKAKNESKMMKLPSETILESLIGKSDRKVLDILDTTHKKIESMMKKDLEDIPEKCREEYQEKFGITIPKFSDSYSRNKESKLSIDQPDIKTISRSYNTYERRWYTLWAWEHKVTSYYNQYQISYTKIAEATHFSYIKQFGDFVNVTNENIKTSTIEVVDSQIKLVTDYINGIKETLSDALKVKNFNAEDKQDLIDVLSQKVEVYKTLREIIERDKQNIFRSN